MPTLTRETAVGSEFAGRPKTVSWERLWTFSGGPFTADGWPRKNIHTDLETAKALGVYTVSASATQYFGYVVSLLIDLFGERWLSSGSITAKFIAIVTVKDVIQAKARVTETRPDGDNGHVFQLDIWCENQDGAKVLVGSATGTVN